MVNVARTINKSGFCTIYLRKVSVTRSKIWDPHGNDSAFGKLNVQTKCSMKKKSTHWSFQYFKLSYMKIRKEQQIGVTFQLLACFTWPWLDCKICTIWGGSLCGPGIKKRKKYFVNAATKLLMYRYTIYSFINVETFTNNFCVIRRLNDRSSSHVSLKLCVR